MKHLLAFVACLIAAFFVSSIVAYGLYYAAGPTDAQLRTTYELAKSKIDQDRKNQCSSSYKSTLPPYSTFQGIRIDRFRRRVIANFSTHEGWNLHRKNPAMEQALGEWVIAYENSSNEAACSYR